MSNALRRGRTTGYSGSMQSRDTSREASEVQRSLQQKLGPAGRVELAFAMSQQAREISISGMMDRDPRLTYS